MLNYITRLIISGMVCLVLCFSAEKYPQANVLHTKEKQEWIWPADGVVSDTFGTRNGKHKGIDIAGKFNSPIMAADDGIVEKSYFSNSYGNVIFIHHKSNFVTVYAHLNHRYVVEGQAVNRGQIIGRMGRSGQATGVHLHFETHLSEWTYEKKFAFDPEGLLGVKRLGEVIQAGTANREENALEASTRFPLKEENKLNPQSTEKNINQKEYVVRKGDTLLSISHKKNIAVRELKIRNHLTNDVIQPGQILIVK